MGSTEECSTVQLLTSSLEYPERIRVVSVFEMLDCLLASVIIALSITSLLQTGQETTQYDFGCTCLRQLTQRHVSITPTSPKEPILGYTLLHTWKKKIINFKISQELIKHLQDEEEEYDNKYTEYCEN